METLNELPRAVIIGAYGGEHVGDAAILGGVCLRINQRYGIKNFIVLSIRPHRTKRWVRTLHLPFFIDVQLYTFQHAGNLLKDAALLVYGGGPIMELPYLLSKHLLTTYQAKANQVNFVIEGCGIGPINTRISNWLAKSLINAATDVSIRTLVAAEHPIVTNRDVKVGVDPAFDYLATRDQVKLSSQDSELFERLVRSSQQRTIIINLRSLWKKYISNEVKKNTLEIQQSFEARFLSALSRLNHQFQNDATFIFFPMNSDQFGFSDLEVGYRLAEKADQNIDFRILEYEPGIDFLLHLIRSATLAITMRFHASIFTLSQRIPTIGIDYSVGRIGKVTELFIDQRKPENVIGVDNFSSEWLLERVAGLLAK
jgi:polysaccharide pyruvyl transferase WcaK-like protein